MDDLLQSSSELTVTSRVPLCFFFSVKESLEMLPIKVEGIIVNFKIKDPD